MTLEQRQTLARELHARRVTLVRRYPSLEEKRMQSVKPIQITFRQLRPSPELTDLVQREAEHLMAHRPPIVTVRAALELPHRRHRKGTPVRVSVEVGVPGRTLVARARHEDPRAAVHEAFDAAERALRSYRGRRRAVRQRVWLPWLGLPESH